MTEAEKPLEKLAARMTPAQRAVFHQAAKPPTRVRVAVSGGPGSGATSSTPNPCDSAGGPGCFVYNRGHPRISLLVQPKRLILSRVIRAEAAREPRQTAALVA